MVVPYRLWSCGGIGEGCYVVVPYRLYTFPNTMTKPHKPEKHLPTYQVHCILIGIIQ